MTSTEINDGQCYINIVYYNTDHSKTPGSTEKSKKLFNFTYSTPSSWNELIFELEKGCKFLVFHSDMLLKSTSPSMAQFIEAVIIISKLISPSKDLKMGVIITKKTPVSVVRTLQQLGVQGIVLDWNSYTSAEVQSSTNALINGIPYWPKHIIDNLPCHENRPLNVYFRQDWKTCLSILEKQKFEERIGMNSLGCSSWSELDAAISKRPHQIIVSIDTIKMLNVTIPEIMMMLDTRIKIAELDIPIAVGIEITTPLEVIKELKKSGVFGIVPSSTFWGIDECSVGIIALRDRIPYWPKHIIAALPGNTKKTIEPGKIRLTDRQEQVFRCITERGSSNKVIARTLGITESTVKLHVTEILKKYGVKNRTQLAVFSKPR